MSNVSLSVDEAKKIIKDFISKIVDTPLEEKYNEINEGLREDDEKTFERLKQQAIKYFNRGNFDSLSKNTIYDLITVAVLLISNPNEEKEGKEGKGSDENDEGKYDDMMMSEIIEMKCIEKNILDYLI